MTSAEYDRKLDDLTKELNAAQRQVRIHLDKGGRKGDDGYKSLKLTLDRIRSQIDQHLEAGDQ